MNPRFRLCLLLMLCVLTVAGQPFSSPGPKYEARAVWLTTVGGLDWPHTYARSAATIARQQQELRETLDRLERAGINQVLLQTRIRATTLYPSRLEPWDGCVSGTPGRSPGYDPLGYAIEQCHERGMELHAWVVCMPVGRWDGAGCRALRSRNPRLVRRIGTEGYMDPERVETASYLAGLCEEIVSRYDVDGIHLDYIRYPETWTLRIPRSEARDNITRIVTAIERRIRPVRPYVKLSCAPIGKYDDLPRYSSRGWNAYTRVCQDAQGWLRMGIIDEILPMMYFRGEQFYPFALDWMEHSCGRIVAPGLGIYFLSPREKDWPLTDITREMQVTRAMGLGHAYFRSRFLTDDVKGIYRYARETDHTLALVPPMTWRSRARPAQPAEVTLASDGTLRWGPAGGGLLYNVYASHTYPVDTRRGENLILRRTTRLETRVPARYALMYYAVCATDRYGLESEPRQMTPPDTATAREKERKIYRIINRQRERH